MTTPVTLTAAAAITYAQTSTNQIIVYDSGTNIAVNADALVKLGVQLVKVYDTNDYLSKGGFISAISVADVLALAPKMFSTYNAAMLFSNVADTAQNVAANAAALLKINSQVIGMTVTDTAKNIAAQSTLFSVGSELTTLIMDGTAYKGASTVAGTWAINLTASAAATLSADGMTGGAIQVTDAGANIAANANALALLGTQLLQVHDTNEYNTSGGFQSAINVANVLALAAKTINAVGKPMQFGNVVDTAQNVAANVAALLKISSQLIGLTVNDTAKNIAAQPAIFTLGNTLTGLVIDGTAFSGATTVKGAWAINVSAAAAATLYADGMTGGVIQVSDTGANIAANADALAKLGTQLLQVYDTNELNYSGGYHANISVADVLALAPKMLDNLHNSMFFPHVLDSTQNIAANLDAMQALGLQVRGISFTDAGTPTLTLTAGQYSNDAIVVKTITTKAFNLVITQVSVANAASVLASHAAVTIAVTDSAANVQANLTLLQTEAKAGQLAGITLTDSSPSFTVSASQFVASSGVWGQISSAYQLVVTGATAANVATLLATPMGQGAITGLSVTDSAANIAANLDSLQAGAAKITGLALTDSGTPTLAITASQWANDSGILNLIKTAYQVSVSGITVANLAALLGNSHVASASVSDSAANIAANLDSLQAGAAKITGIVLTDSGVPGLAITASQLANDSNVIKMITSHYNLVITQVSIANAASVLANHAVAAIAVTDSAANVQANLALLQTEAKAGQLAGITLTDSSPSFTVSASQFVASSGVWGQISSAYQVVVTGATVANVATLLATPMGQGAITGLSVTDSAANIAANLDSLQAGAAKITGLALTDSGTPTPTPTLAITASQWANDSGILNLIKTAYQVSVSGITVANLAALLGNSHVASASVSDSAANIAANLDSLQAGAAKITGIVLTDSGVPTLAITASQWANDSGILNLIKTAYQVSVSGITVANLAALLGNSHVASVGLSDSANNVFSALNNIQANLSKVATVTLTDSATKPTVSLTASQYASDANALAKINASNNYQLTVTGETAALFAKDVSDTHVATVNLTDSAANVTANLTNLQTNINKLGTIVLSDGGIPQIAVNAAQYAADAAALAKINGAYNLVISGESVAKVGNDMTNSHVTSIGISDTAAHVVSSLATLQSQLSNLSGITLTDAGTPTVSVTAAQVTADAGVLNAIQTANLLSVKDTSAAINTLSLSGVHNTNIELMLTNLSTVANKAPLTLTENTTITNLNLSLISLTGDTINEKVYNSTGTEIDLLNSKGTVINQFLFTHETEAQLHLLGVNPAVVHLM